MICSNQGSHIGHILYERKYINYQGSKWVDTEDTKKIQKKNTKDLNPLHSIANGVGLSANLGKAETEESTTICFSWLRYPRMKPL